MGILGRMDRQIRADVTWDAADDRWYTSLPFGGPTWAGPSVGPDSASQTSAVFACNSLILETVASLPCVLYRRLDNGGKERATDHRWYRPIRMQPNAWQTSMDYFSYGQGHLGLRGTVVSEIRDGARPELVPLHPATVQVEQLDTGRCRVVQRDPRTGRERTLTQDEVLIVRDSSMDGLTGQARAVLARQAIGVALAGEQMVGSWLRNDATGRVVITKPGPVPDEKKRQENRKMIRENYAGSGRRGETMLMYGDVKVEELGKHDTGAFIIDPRKFQVSDIARFWRVPGFMIGLEEKSTSWGTGIEQQKQGFIDFTIRPWLVRWEQALARDLLSEEEQEEFFFEFNLDAMLRGDLDSTVKALEIERRNGALSANEWRIIRNRNPRDGGDAYQDELQGAPASNRAESPARQRPPADEDDDDTEARAVPAPLLADAAARITGEEIREVGKRAGKAKADGLKFVAWARKFAAEHTATTARVLAPLAEAYGLDGWAVNEAAQRIQGTFADAMTIDGAPDGWADRRRAEVAQVIDETFRAARAVERQAA